ncbi:MAG: hypothetical protein WD851_21230 [Pirellulales bacterium]
MPRPRIMNEITRAITCDLLAHGATLNFVAHFLGCSKRTIQAEARRDPEFRADLERADTEGAITVLRQFHEASRKNWRASKWFLQERFPERFARRR